MKGGRKPPGMSSGYGKPIVSAPLPMTMSSGYGRPSVPAPSPTTMPSGYGSPSVAAPSPTTMPQGYSSPSVVTPSPTSTFNENGKIPVTETSGVQMYEIDLVNNINLDNLDTAIIAEPLPSIEFTGGYDMEFIEDIPSNQDVPSNLFIEGDISEMKGMTLIPISNMPILEITPTASESYDEPPKPDSPNKSNDIMMGTIVYSNKGDPNSNSMSIIMAKPHNPDNNENNNNDNKDDSGDENKFMVMKGIIIGSTDQKVGQDIGSSFMEYYNSQLENADQQKSSTENMNNNPSCKILESNEEIIIENKETSTKPSNDASGNDSKSGYSGNEDSNQKENDGNKVKESDHNESINPVKDKEEKSESTENDSEKESSYSSYESNNKTDEKTDESSSATYSAPQNAMTMIERGVMMLKSTLKGLGELREDQSTTSDKNQPTVGKLELESTKVFESQTNQERVSIAENFGIPQSGL